MYVLDAPCRRETRKAPTLTPPAFLFLVGAMTVEVAAATAVSQGSTIWDTTSLRAFCAMGAAGGAAMAVIAWPRQSVAPNSGTRDMAAKFLASSIGGMAFTPLVFAWGGLTLNVDVVLGVSSVVAFLTVATLEVVASVWKKLVARAIEAKAAAITGPSDTPKQ